MSFPQVSFPTREYCRARLTDATSGFNYQITQTAPTFGVNAFQLSEKSSPPSLFLGRYNYDMLRKAIGDRLILPCAVLSTAKADNIRSNLKITPSNFSGSISVSIDFYVSPGQYSNIPPDGEAMYFAVEAAVVNAFNTQLAYGLMPGGTTYNNEVVVEQDTMLYDGTRWIQWIPVTLNFTQVS